jgi:hypothetical protein
MKRDRVVAPVPGQNTPRVEPATGPLVNRWAEPEEDRSSMFHWLQLPSLRLGFAERRALLVAGDRIGIVGGLLRSIVVYILSLASVFVAAYIIDFLAGTFGARKNLGNAMKVSAYAPTAAWLAGVFNIIPALAILGILGLYSLYLLHTGIAALMKPPADKALIYTIAVIVCAIILWVIIFTVPAMFFGMGLMM